MSDTQIPIFGEHHAQHLDEADKLPRKCRACHRAYGKACRRAQPAGVWQPKKREPAFKEEHRPPAPVGLFSCNHGCGTFATVKELCAHKSSHNTFQQPRDTVSPMPSSLKNII